MHQRSFRSAQPRDPPDSRLGAPWAPATMPLVERADAASVEEILSLLSARAGIDFESYKKGTLLRRILQRMRLQRIDVFADYARFLRGNSAELDALFDDVLIGVTAFFRDPEAWEHLRTHVVPDLLASQPPDRPLRVWVAGCATGEEPYSVGMLLLEALDDAARPVPIKIFATDVDVNALAIARRGRYARDRVARVPIQRINRFFISESREAVRVAPVLRDCVVFARHDVLSDPPYAHLDLITCRNLLMYLQLAAQQRVLERFHFGVRAGGYLFLGPPEGIGRRCDLFEPISQKWRFYRRI